MKKLRQVIQTAKISDSNKEKALEELNRIIPNIATKEASELLKMSLTSFGTQLGLGRSLVDQKYSQPWSTRQLSTINQTRPDPTLMNNRPNPFRLSTRFDLT